MKLSGVLKVVIASCAISLMAAHLSPATAAPAAQVITCVDLASGKERNSKTDTCRTTEAVAKWHLAPTDSALASGGTTKSLTICSNKESSPFTYQRIRTSCYKHMQTNLYTRSSTLPAKPIITQVSSTSYESASLSLASDPAANVDAPIAFYTITSSKGDVKKVNSWRELTVTVNGLRSSTSYTFTITATSVDGTSPVSESSLPVTTQVYVAPVTTSPTPTCATGGVCIVGDRGPGGGIVYYVSATPFTSTGSTCNTTCKYLEVAPAGWNNGAVVANDPPLVWSTNMSLTTGQDTVTASTQGVAALGAYRKLNWEIGQGFYNTSVMKVAGATSTAQAAVLAYAGSSTAGQWFIPSANELNELCKYARGQTTGVLTVACTFGGTFKSTANAGTDLGGFVEANNFPYWSSSEYSASVAWHQGFDNGRRSGDDKQGAYSVRPVRAF